MSEVAERPRLTADAMIERYVKLRDKKKEIEARHKDELAPFNDAMKRLEGFMLEALNQSGLDSMKSAHGTAFKSTRTSATVKDWPLTLAFIREHQAWDLLEARVAKTVAYQIIADTQAPIPGVETSAELTVNVRRPSAG